MVNHYFISYSNTDGREFATRLADDLLADTPFVPVWLGKRDLQPGSDYDDQLVEALRSCVGLLFVMTKDSTHRKSECKKEWMRALKYKKPIIPLLFDCDAELPYKLEPREYIDFTANYASALARLRKYIQWRTSPDGVLHTLKDRLADAERDLPRADPGEKPRIKDEIQQLEQQITEQQTIVDDPQAAEVELRKNIESGIEQERKPRKSIDELKHIKFVNAPPLTAPSWFQNRHVESGLIGTFLKDPALRLMTVVGRGGIGKTAMVCRLLKSLEFGQLPDDAGPLDVDGIVYLGPSGSHHVRFPDLFADLSRLLPDKSTQLLDSIFKNPHSDSRAKMQVLLENFPQGRIVVLLDNFEDVVDPVEGHVADNELFDALRAILEAPHHGLKVLVTTRVAPRDLMLLHPERQMPLEMDKGLGYPYAENILRNMDGDGTLGLRDAPDDLLAEARERTRGYPRALEALVAILRVDRGTSLQEILNDTQQLLPEDVVQTLVGEAFSRLDPRMQQVMQALAVYARQVPPTAVDYLLQPYLPGINGAALLKRLVAMEFARCEAGHCYLHPIDRTFALEQVPEGQPEDWQGSGTQPFTRCSLWHRAAEFFRKIRLDESEWLSVENVSPLLAEFELLVSSGDFENALDVLNTLWPFLYDWGHSRQIQRLADRLATEADDPVRDVASGIAGSAFYMLGDLAEAVAHLKVALTSSHAKVDAGQLSLWRLTLADIYLLQGSNEAAAEYRTALEAAQKRDDIDTQITALIGLGNVAEAQNDYAAAADEYRKALQVCVESTISEITVEEDNIVFGAGTLLPDLPINDPWAWHPLPPIELEDEDQPPLLLYGIAIPEAEEEDVKPAHSQAEPEEPAKQADQDEDTGQVAVAPVLISAALGDVWMSFAGLYARTDHPSDAAACCQLALGIYQALDLGLDFARALDLLRQLAPELPEADADEILTIQEENLRNARQSTSRLLEITMLDFLADSYLARSRIKDAENIYRDLSLYATELEDPALSASAERGMARVDWARGDTDQAVGKLQALLRQPQNDLQFQADTEMMLGNIEFEGHHRDLAAEHYTAAGQIYAALGSLRDQVTVEQMLANVAMNQRDYDVAVRRLEEALPVARQIGIASLTASLLCALADAYLSAGDRENALSTGREAFEITAQIELPSTVAETLMSFGNLLVRMENLEPAEKALLQARDIYRDAGNVSAEISALHDLARLYDKTQQRVAETDVARQAWELAQQLGDGGELKRAKVELALALSDGGEHAEAIRHMEEVVRENPRDGYSVGSLGWVCFQAGEYDRCLEESHRALELDPAQTWVIRNLGHSYLAKKLPDEAEREYRRAIEDRKGGEDFLDTIREIRKLLAENPDLPRGKEMLQLIEDEQARLNSLTANNTTATA